MLPVSLNFKFNLVIIKDVKHVTQQCRVLPSDACVQVACRKHKVIAHNRNTV